MGNQLAFLYFGSAKTFALIGHGFAEALQSLWARRLAAKAGSVRRQQGR
jgi:hypothetical protein